MSTILVIEPRKILQHATAIALFPDHEARVVDAIPETRLVEQCDAVIVDAVALREIGALSAQAFSAMDGWTVPVVWIDSDSAHAPKCGNLAIIRRPVSRDELRATLAACLGRHLMARPGAQTAPPEPPRGAIKSDRQKAAAGAKTNPRVIDLVEVVEEAPPAHSKSKK